MKRKQLTEEQVIGILRQAERGPSLDGEACAASGAAEALVYPALVSFQEDTAMVRLRMRTRLYAAAVRVNTRLTRS